MNHVYYSVQLYDNIYNENPIPFGSLSFLDNYEESGKHLIIPSTIEYRDYQVRIWWVYFSLFNFNLNINQVLYISVQSKPSTIEALYTSMPSTIPLPHQTVGLFLSVTIVLFVCTLLRNHLHSHSG